MPVNVLGLPHRRSKIGPNRFSAALRRLLPCLFYSRSHLLKLGSGKLESSLRSVIVCARNSCQLNLRQVGPSRETYGGLPEMGLPSSQAAYSDHVLAVDTAGAMLRLMSTLISLAPGLTNKHGSNIFMWGRDLLRNCFKVLAPLKVFGDDAQSPVYTPQLKFRFRAQNAIQSTGSVTS